MSNHHNGEPVAELEPLPAAPRGASNPKPSGLLGYLGMIAGVAFLLLVSLAVSAALSAAGGVISGFLPPGFSAPLLHGIEFIVSLSIIAALFAAIFKVLPDVKLEWRQVCVGAVATAVLFTAGKFLIGFYMGKSGAASAYGAAGSLVIIVLWIYYASIIFLLGAEFTSVWAETHGYVAPEPGAVRFVEKEERVDSWMAEGRAFKTGERRDS